MKQQILFVLTCLLLLVSFFASFFLYSGAVVSKCIDSDGGKNVFVAGMVQIGTASIDDTCIEQKLQEFWCASGNLKYSIESCPGSCSDGACTVAVAQPVTPIASIPIASGTDKLEVGEYIGSVVATITEDDTALLQDQILHTGAGSTIAHQYLRFKTNDFENGKLVLDDNDANVLDHYLFFNGGDPIFEYEMGFSDGWSSSVDDGNLVDLIGKDLSLLGKQYLISRAHLTGTTLELSLLGSAHLETLSEGETRMYHVDDRTVTLTLTQIDDENREVLLSVDGTSLGSFAVGDAVPLSSGYSLGIASVFLSDPGEGTDFMTFSFGSDFLILKDKYTDSSFSSGTKVNGISVPEGRILFTGALDGDTFTLSTMKYQLLADALKGQDVFVAPGETLRSELQHPAALFGNWDLAYAGFVGEEKTDSLLRLTPHADTSYTLSFKNTRGESYDVDYVTNVGGSLQIGSSTHTLHFIEPASTVTFSIQPSDWIVVTSDDSVHGVTSILRYDSLDATTKHGMFDDLAGGTHTFSYTGTEGTDASGHVTVNGIDYTVYVGSAPNYPLAVDLNRDGDISSDEVHVIIHGGGILDLGSSMTPGGDFSLTLTTKSQQFDESHADETLTFTIQRVSDHVDLTVPSQSNFTLESEDGKKVGLSGYGVKVEQKTSSDADSLRVYYPTAQAFGDVRILFYSTPAPVVVPSLPEEESLVVVSEEIPVVEAPEPVAPPALASVIPVQQSLSPAPLSFWQRLLSVFKYLFRLA